MLIGTFYHSLEAKGRFSLPKAFRDASDAWVITAGLDGCLFVFKKSDFEAQATQLASLSYYKADHRQLIRHFAAHASEQQTDNLGRLSISDDLQKMAKLQKNIVIVGALTHLEVWDQERYHTWLDQQEGSVEESSERLMP